MGSTAALRQAPGLPQATRTHDGQPSLIQTNPNPVFWTHVGGTLAAGSHPPSKDSLPGVYKDHGMAPARCASRWPQSCPNHPILRDSQRLPGTLVIGMADGHSETSAGNLWPYFAPDWTPPATRPPLTDHAAASERQKRLLIGVCRICFLVGLPHALTLIASRPRLAALLTRNFIIIFSHSAVL